MTFMTKRERRITAQAAMLNTEAIVFEAHHSARLELLLADCSLEEITEIQRAHPSEWHAITEAMPDPAQLETLNRIIFDAAQFAMLPAEDRNYIAIGRVWLYEARDAMIAVHFNTAIESVFKAADRLHWVACERKRNNTRAHHKEADPNTLARLDRVAQRCYGFVEELRPAAKVSL